MLSFSPSPASILAAALAVGCLVSLSFHDSTISLDPSAHSRRQLRQLAADPKTVSPRDEGGPRPDPRRALIEGASLEADSMIQKQMAANIDALKTSFDANLNKVVQVMQSSNENFDAQINRLNQYVVSMTTEISAVKTLLEDGNKQKLLQGALDLTDIQSFKYFIAPQSDKWRMIEENSSELSKSVLRSFLLGYGATLPEASLTEVDYYHDKSESEKQAMNKAFVDKLSNQVEDLIRRKPRLAKNAGHIYTIYYS